MLKPLCFTNKGARSIMVFGSVEERERYLQWSGVAGTICAQLDKAVS